MAWNSSVNGGFNDGHEPWQCVNTNYKEINVENDLKSDRSVFRFYQELLAFRKNSDVIRRGTTTEYDHEHRRIICYAREYEDSKLLILGNFSKKTVKYRLPEGYGSMRMRFGNYESLDRQEDVLTLKPYQAVVMG